MEGGGLEEEEGDDSELTEIEEEEEEEEEYGEEEEGDRNGASLQSGEGERQGEEEHKADGDPPSTITTDVQQPGSIGKRKRKRIVFDYDLASTGSDSLLPSPTKKPKKKAPKAAPAMTTLPTNSNTHASTMPHPNLATPGLPITVSSLHKFVLEDEESRIGSRPPLDNDTFCASIAKGTTRYATLNILDTMQTNGEMSLATLKTCVDPSVVPLADDIMDILVATPLVHHAKYPDKPDEGTYIYRSGRQLAQHVHLHGMREQLQSEQRKLATCSARISVLKQELGGRTNRDRLVGVLKELLASDPSLAEDELYKTIIVGLGIEGVQPTQ